MSIELICNQALDAIGHKRHIDSIWEGTPEARIALNTWSDTRDALLMIVRPDFSVWDDPLQVFKAAPPYYDDIRLWTPDDPDLPWRYEYKLPDSCLVPLAIKPRPSYLPVWRPHWARFRIKGSQSAADYVLLGDDPAPVLTCVHSVVDVRVWHNDFIEQMVRTLAKKFQVVLGEGPPAKEKADGDNTR